MLSTPPPTPMRHSDGTPYSNKRKPDKEDPPEDPPRSKRSRLSRPSHVGPKLLAENLASFVGTPAYAQDEIYVYKVLVIVNEHIKDSGSGSIPNDLSKAFKEHSKTIIDVVDAAATHPYTVSDCPANVVTVYPTINQAVLSHMAPDLSALTLKDSVTKPLRARPYDATWGIVPMHSAPGASCGIPPNVGSSLVSVMDTLLTHAKIGTPLMLSCELFHHVERHIRKIDDDVLSLFENTGRLLVHMLKKCPGSSQLHTSYVSKLGDFTTSNDKSVHGVVISAQAIVHL